MYDRANATRHNGKSIEMCLSIINILYICLPLIPDFGAQVNGSRDMYVPTLYKIALCYTLASRNRNTRMIRAHENAKCAANRLWFNTFGPFAEIHVLYLQQDTKNQYNVFHSYLYNLQTRTIELNIERLLYTKKIAKKT